VHYVSNIIRRGGACGLRSRVQATTGKARGTEKEGEVGGV